MLAMAKIKNMQNDAAMKKAHPAITAIIALFIINSHVLRSPVSIGFERNTTGRHRNVQGSIVLANLVRST
jgi:hypothetical protein